MSVLSALMGYGFVFTISTFHLAAGWSGGILIFLLPSVGPDHRRSHLLLARSQPPLIGHQMRRSAGEAGERAGEEGAGGDGRNLAHPFSPGRGSPPSFRLAGTKGRKEGEEEASASACGPFHRQSTHHHRHFSDRQANSEFISRNEWGQERRCRMRSKVHVLSKEN